MSPDLTLFQSIGLGFIQGLTEFLPVSSSGHLVIGRALCHWSDDGGLVFDTVLHAGSLAAILIYFRRDWLAVLKGYVNPRDANFAWHRRLPWLLAVATLPAAVAGPLFKPYLESDAAVRNLPIVGLSMLATALLFWWCENRAAAGAQLPAEQTRAPGAVRSELLRALAIGCLQVVALLPGASRSGWTTGGGMLCGLPRESAVRFAFFMALPAIGGAVVFQLKDILAGPAHGMAPIQLGLGFMVSFLVSLGAIHFCLKFFRNHSLRGFAVYLAAAGSLAFLAGIFHVVE